MASSYNTTSKGMNKGVIGVMGAKKDGKYKSANDNAVSNWMQEEMEKLKPKDSQRASAKSSNASSVKEDGWYKLDQYAVLKNKEAQIAEKTRKKNMQKEQAAVLQRQVVERKQLEEDLQREEEGFAKQMNDNMNEQEMEEHRQKMERDKRIESQKREAEEQMHQLELKKQEEELERLEEKKKVAKLIQSIDKSKEKESRQKQKKIEQAKKIHADNEMERRKKEAKQREEKDQELKKLNEYLQAQQEREKEMEKKRAQAAQKQLNLFDSIADTHSKNLKEKEDRENEIIMKQRMEQDMKQAEMEIHRQKRMQEITDDVKNTLDAQVKQKKNLSQKEKDELHKLQKLQESDAKEYERRKKEESAKKRSEVEAYRAKIEADVALKKERRAVGMSAEEIRLNKNLLEAAESALGDEERLNRCKGLEKRRKDRSAAKGVIDSTYSSSESESD